MSNENTVEITTVGGYKVLFSTFITGRQKRYITDSFLEDVEIKGDAKETSSSFSMKGTKTNVANDRAIEAVVLKVEGPTVNAEAKILDQVLDLPADDYAEVMKKAEEITGDKKKDESTPTA